MFLLFSRIRNNASNRMSSVKEHGKGLFASLAEGASGHGHSEAAGDEVDGDEPKGRRTPPHEAGFSYVPIGAGTAAGGKGVYYLVMRNNSVQFRANFKKCSYN